MRKSSTDALMGGYEFESADLSLEVYSMCYRADWIPSYG